MWSPDFVSATAVPAHIKCATPGCRKQKCPNPAGGYFNYCSKYCRDHGADLHSRMYRIQTCAMLYPSSDNAYILCSFHPQPSRSIWLWYLQPPWVHTTQVPWSCQWEGSRFLWKDARYTGQSTRFVAFLSVSWVCMASSFIGVSLSLHRITLS